MHSFSPLSGDNAIYFLHIPKTAGTSFTNCLSDQYPAELICPVHLWHDLLSIPPERLSEYRVFRGHFYAYLYRVVSRPLKIITFLRDPIERALSHYEHIRRYPEHYFHERLHEQSTLLAFSQDPLTNPLISNFQTRSLALDLDPVEIAAGFSNDEIQLLKLEQKLETYTPSGITENELLERAKAQIDECLFVGLTEQFSESVHCLSEILQWQRSPESYFLNSAPARKHKDELGSETFKALISLNYLDYELYNYVLSGFEKRKNLILKSQISLLTDNLSNLQSSLNELEVERDNLTLRCQNLEDQTKKLNQKNARLKEAINALESSLVMRLRGSVLKLPILGNTVKTIYQRLTGKKIN